MKVKCIANRHRDLPKELQEYYGVRSNLDIIAADITVGNEYVVYGIAMIKNHNVFLVCGDNYDGKNIVYPNYFFHGFFEIVDPRVSSFWVAKQIIQDVDTAFVAVGLVEFFDDPEEFHSNVIDNISPDMERFIELKEKLDNEYNED